MTTPTLTVLVTGARGDAVPEELVACVLATVCPEELILGDCPSGVDLYAYRWWLTQPANRVQCHVYGADWTAFGASAGPKRNAAMVDMAVARRARGNDVIVLAFPLGGPGTAGCIKLAEAAGLTVELF